MGILQFIFARARSTQESSHRFHACSPVRWFLLFRCWRCCCCCCRAYCTWIRPHSTHSSARSHCQPHNPSYIHINFTFARNQVAIFRNILIYSFNAKNYMMYFVRNQCSYTQSFLHIQYIYMYINDINDANFVLRVPALWIWRSELKQSKNGNEGCTKPSVIKTYICERWPDVLGVMLE